MTNHTFISHFWEGFSISDSKHSDSLITITLVPSSTGICQCGRRAERVHDKHWRLVRDASILGKAVQLRVQTRRLDCRVCGVKVEMIPWLPPFSRMTRRLINYIETLLPILPIKHISELTGIHWHTIKNLDKSRLNRTVPKINWPSITRLVMDEFALFKGHKYATVIADADTHQVLWVGMGRSREQIRPFFEEMGEYAQNIQAVAMDMNTAFDLEVKMHCPNARIVYDLFHVVAKYGREVIDRVRVDQANRLKHDKKARKWVKRSRWVLLKNRVNLNPKEHQHLDELLAMNKDLTVTYLLGEQLKEIWYCSTEEHSKALWDVWWSQVQESAIKPIMDFARKLKPYLSGITSSAVHALNTCTLEGMNNKIKLIKRMGYGYRDTDYFFLKIKAAFPGKMR